MTTTITTTRPATAVAQAHRYRMPSVREVVCGTPHQPLRQRDLVLASLVACPRDAQRSTTR